MMTLELGFDEEIDESLVDGFDLEEWLNNDNDQNQRDQRLLVSLCRKCKLIKKYIIANMQNHTN